MNYKTIEVALPEELQFKGDTGPQVHRVIEIDSWAFDCYLVEGRWEVFELDTDATDRLQDTNLFDGNGDEDSFEVDHSDWNQIIDYLERWTQGATA